VPHVIVKLRPGKSEQQKQKLADEITKAVMTTLHYGGESVRRDGRGQSIRLDREGLQAGHPRKAGTIYKEPGYGP
jgi:4-oxalocrotonate tautomerase